MLLLQLLLLQLLLLLLIFLKKNPTRDTDASEDDFFTCLDSRVSANEASLRAAGVCYFPSFRSILERMPSGADSFPPCANATEWHRSLMLMYRVLDEYFTTTCPRPDREAYFTALTRFQVREY